MTFTAVAVVSTISSSLEANSIFSTVNETKRRSSFITMEDTMIKYTSMMGLEDKMRRFSEDVVDVDLKDSERVKKLYRQIQWQVPCGQETKLDFDFVVCTLKHQ
jgi:hypothetical protein